MSESNSEPRRSRIKNLMATFYGVGTKEGKPMAANPRDMDAASFESEFVFKEMLRDSPLNTLQDTAISLQNGKLARFVLLTFMIARCQKAELEIADTCLRELQ